MVNKQKTGQKHIVVFLPLQATRQKQISKNGMVW
jgi:hypothetical protein